MTAVKSIVPLLGLVFVLPLSSLTAGAQSVLDRTPNLQNGWIGEVVQFNFNHRLHQSEIGGEQRLLASPTFLLGVPIQEEVLVAAQYASSSEVVESNEWEVLGRWAPVEAGGRFPFNVAITAAYNTAAESADGELSLSLPISNVELLGVARAFSGAYETTDYRMAFGGGVIARVSNAVAFAGDVVTLADRNGDEEVAWGVGLQLEVPQSPHTFSLQVTNTASGTLHGSTRGIDTIYWGFEFTTPLTFLGGD